MDDFYVEDIKEDRMLMHPVPWRGLVIADLQCKSRFSCSS